jgi:hypothetical protein
MLNYHLSLKLKTEINGRTTPQQKNKKMGIYKQ